MSRLTRTLALAAILAAAAGGPAQAQQTGTLSGRVVDANTLQPISSAQVFIPSLNLGSLTREDGRYLLVNVPAGTHSVRAQTIGYRSANVDATVAPGQTATADFSMQQDALALDEVIVTGTPGGTQRRAIGNVVTRVSAEEIVERAPVANMQDLLTSRAPGLDFQRTNGNVGTGSQIRIRGVSSLSLGGQPLIYVDGVRVDNATDKGPNLSNRGASSSAFDDINPDDIASIEVIKGPAAATLYGTEASAGVIQIITKKGQTGAPQFSLNVTQGTNFMMDPAGKLGDQYYKDRQTGELKTFNLYELEKERGNELFDYGHVQGYNLSVRGGTDAVRYYLSGDWDDQVGILDYNTNDRASMRANVGVLISEGLNLDVSTGFVTGDTRYLQGTATVGDVWDQLIWAQGANIDRPSRGFLQYTPEQLREISATREYKRFTGSATVTHTPFEWLTQRLIVGNDYSSDENTTLIPRHPDGVRGPFRGQSLGEIVVERPLNNELTFDYSASGKYGFGPGMQWTSSVGAQYYATEFNRLTSEGRTFSSPTISSIGAATTSRILEHAFVQNKSLGFFVQQELNLNDRIYLTGAVRMDDNSAFGSEFDAAVYPKVSAAWVVSEEPFFAPFSDYVGSFRLRSALGKAGRQPDVLAAVTLYDAAVGPGGAAAVTPSKIGNPHIGPEVSTELELGFEASAFADRIVVDFTHFRQWVRNALGAVPQASSWGFPGSQDGNIARLDNWGWELSMNLGVLRRENVSFDLGFTGAHSMNEIVDLGPRQPTNEMRVGFPYPVWTSINVRSAEFDASGRVVNPMCDQGTLDAEGNPTYRRGGASVPCADVRGYELFLGTQYPTHMYTVTPTLRLFNNLEIFGLIDSEFGRWGNDVSLWCRHTRCSFANVRDGVMRDDPTYVYGAITSPTPDRTMISRYDADFVKLREIGGRVQIPRPWLQRTGMNSAALSVSARNLWNLWQAQTHVRGAPIPDLETASPTGGAALFQWPGLSSITAALRVTF